MKFKKYTIDLGGEFPAKREAVKEHLVRLGYKKLLHDGEPRYIYLSKNGNSSWNRNSPQSHILGELITAEKFLELDVGKDPDFYYRHRVWLEDGCIFDMPEYCRANNCNQLEFGSGAIVDFGQRLIMFKRISKGVTKVDGQS